MKREKLKPVYEKDVIPADSIGNTSGSNTIKAPFYLWLTGIGIVSFIFLVLKMYVIQAYASDEGIYVYQGKLVAEGFIPYKDFAMAHPPVQSLFTAFLFKVIGYHFKLFRLIPILWCLTGGVLLSIIVKRELGAVASVFAMALFILSYEPLRASSHFTGINMTIALLMGAVLAQRTKYFITSAVFCVLAIFTRLYALPVILILFLVTYFANKKEGIQFLKWQVILGAGLFISFGLWSGFGNMMNDIFLFQSQKTNMNIEKLSDMRDGVLFHNAIPLFLFILGFITILGKYIRTLNSKNQNAGKKKIKKTSVGVQEESSLLWLSVFSVIMVLGILLNMNRVWMYYFVLAFPFAAITGGWMVSNWILDISGLIFSKNKEDGFVRQSNYMWLSGSLALFFISWYLSPRLEKRLGYYEEAIKVSSKSHKTIYIWRDGALPEFLNKAVKTFIWKDERVIGERNSEFTYYLWHVSRILDIKDDVLTEINKHTNPDESIFGDSEMVPLMALLSGRKIAAREVDTNVERYRSGNADPAELIRRIDQPSTKLLLLRKNFGIATIPELQFLVKNKYKMVKEFTSRNGYIIGMFERVPG